MKYPIAMLAPDGEVRMKAVKCSSDGTPRYGVNPNSIDHSYSLVMCFLDGCRPIYSMIEVLRLRKIWEEKWKKEEESSKPTVKYTVKIKSEGAPEFVEGCGIGVLEVGELVVPLNIRPNDFGRLLSDAEELLKEQWIEVVFDILPLTNP